MRIRSSVAALGAQASAALHTRLQARLARQLAAFEIAALASSLHVPMGLLLPGAGPAEPSPADPAAEAAVDVELAALAADLNQVPAPPLTCLPGSADATHTPRPLCHASWRVLRQQASKAGLVSHSCRACDLAQVARSSLPSMCAYLEAQMLGKPRSCVADGVRRAQTRAAARALEGELASLGRELAASGAGSTGCPPCSAQQGACAGWR
jgi:hypothetical protein